MTDDASPLSAPSHSDSLAAEIDAICDRFEAAWKAGQRPRIEDFLPSSPDSGRKDLLRELLVVEIQLRQVGRETPTKHEYISRFPQFAAEIDLAFRMTNAAAGPPGHPQRGGKGNDRNLLFGILAVQMDFISRDALVAAMNAWVLAKDKPLGEILVDQKALAADRCTLLDALVQEHLKQHDNDSEKSLAAVSSLGSMREDLRQIADPDVQASLVHLSAAHFLGEPGATQAHSVGLSTSAGTRFRILRPYAEGGLGRVSVARDEELSREVALKEIKEQRASDPESRERFLREAEITGGLEHPGIVPVYGLGHYADGRPYYAMRFIRGDSLKEAVDRYHDPKAQNSNLGERVVELRELLGRFHDVCNAIAYAHSRGILHRDLKPGNIMLGKYGETLVVDWGLAKAVDRPELKSDSSQSLLKPSSGSGSAATQMGSTLGTPQYMSPEQAAGRLDQLGPASDVYGLGATLYYVLTGRPPIESGDLGTVLSRVQSGDFRPPRAVNPAISRPLEAICLKAMALKPADRYASPKTLADDLEHWLADESITAYRESRRERLARWLRRHRTGAQSAAAALVAIAIAAVAAAVLIGQAERREAAATIKKSRIESAGAIARSFQSGLDAADWTPNRLGSLESLLKEWEPLDSVAANAARNRLHHAYAAYLEAMIRRPRLEPEDIARIEDGLKLLDQRAPAETKPLRELLARRKGVWKPLVDLVAPYGNLAEAFEADAVQSQSGGWKRAAIPADLALAPFVRTRLRSEAGSELEAVFAPDWETGKEIGLRLNSQGPLGYAFVLVAEQADAAGEHSAAHDRPESFRAARSQGAHFVAEIRRNGKPLHRERILAEEIPSGPLRLRAKCERGRLSFQINGRKLFEFLDPSPLRFKGTQFALDWPGEATLRELHALALQGAAETSALEEADKFFDDGHFEKAGAVYRDQAVILGDPRLRQEARYKEALCLLERNQLDHAVGLLKPLMEEAGDPWPLLAGCQLWSCRLRQNHQEDAATIFDYLSSRFDFWQVAPLIPSEIAEQIRAFYLAPIANARQMARTRLPNRQVIERVATIDRFLSPDGRGSEDVMYWLSFLYLVNDDVPDALKVAHDLADAFPTGPSIETYSHLLRLAGKPEEALALIGQHLPAAANRVANLHFSLNLLLERSRVHVALGAWEAAEEDLAEFAAVVREAEEKNVYVDYWLMAKASLLNGFLHERRGDLAGAREIWRAAAARVRPHIKESHLLWGTNLHLILAGSMSDSLTDEDMAILVEKLHEFLGDYSGAVLIKPQLSLETVAPLLRSIGKTRHGREVAKAFAYDTPIDEMRIADWGGLICVLASEVIQQYAFAGELSELQDEVIWNTCKAIRAALIRANWGPAQLGQLALAWKGIGITKPVGWGGLAPTLNPVLRSRFSYILAHRLATLGQQAESELLFRAAIQDAGADLALANMARADLELVAQKKGRLVIESDYPQTASVEVARAGKPPIKIDVAGRQERDLEPGDYVVRFLTPVTNGKLLPTQFRLTPGGQRIVRIDWLWRPGTLEANLPGLVPRPAQLPGLPRWQLDTKASHAECEVITWSPDGKSLASACGDGRVRLISANDRRLIGVLSGHEGPVRALAFSPDGQWLASAGVDKVVRLWNMPGGRLGRELRGHTAIVWCLSWAPDSKRLASGGHWGDNKIRIWDVGGTPGPVIDVNRMVESVAWSPDGKWLASAGASKSVSLWHADGSAGPSLEGHDADVTRVSWSPGGKWLASGGHDKTVRLWSTSNWAPGPVLGPHDYYISSLAWSHDSQTLAVGRQDGFVNAYHPPDKTPIWTTPQTAPIWSLVWKPDDSELLSSDGNSTERHWKRDGTAGKVFPAQLTRIAAIAIGSDGKQLAIGGSDHFFRLWDFSDKLSPVLAGPSLDVRKVVWHPDGTRFATLGDDGSVRIWNAATGKSVTELKTQGNRPTTLAWSHNGKRLATGGQGPSIHLWQADGAAGPVFDRQPDEVLALDWNVDNKCLAVGYGDKDKTIRLINAATGKVGPVCKGHKQAIFDVKWSPDGKRLASASSDGTVRTWQANGQAMAVLQGDWLQRTLAWSPDGKLILGGSIEGTCRLWRADGSLVRAWHAHDAEVTAVAFSNDGQELFSAGNDSVLRCWSSARGDCRRVLVCLHDQQAALFSSSGECLDLPPETAKEFICLIEKPDRSLELVTPAEFEKRWKAAVEK